jgi:inner membrane protein
MDNLTHTLTGLALSRSGLNRFCPRAGLLIMIAANIPDIDMLSLIGGPLRNMEIHRGYTHSLLCLPAMACIPVALTALISRRRLPWLTAWSLACVGIISHLLLDWSMSYGVRLLLPFSSRWFYLDLFSLVDFVLLAMLMLASIAPVFNRLVSDEIGARRQAGRGAAIFALVFLVLYGGFRALMHQRVLAELQSRIYSEVLDGAVLRIAALPQSVNPLFWNSIVEGEHSYRFYSVDAYGTFNPGEGRLLYKAPWDERLQDLSKQEPFRYALYFARFAYWQRSPAITPSGLEKVTLTDLRFGAPGESFFTVGCLVDPTGHITKTFWGTLAPNQRD